MRTSVTELAERLKVDYAHAQGLVKLLEKRGLATLFEKRPNKAGKGKPTNIYELPDKIELDLTAA